MSPVSHDKQPGIGPLADEPKPSQHPIRGEGEPVAWRYRDAWGRWAYCEPLDPATGPKVITEKEPLYAHPPTSYEGEGLREKVAEIVQRAYRDGFYVGPDGGENLSECWNEWLADNPDHEAILQALQSASGK